MKGVTSEDPEQADQTPLPKAVIPYCFNRILGTGGIEAACWGGKGGEEPLIYG